MNARGLDFTEGEDEAPRRVVAGFVVPMRPVHLEVSVGGVTTYLTVFPQSVATLGRASDSDICVRVEPTSVPENRDKTFRISASHLVLRYLGDELQMVDTNSSNGTESAKHGSLRAGQPMQLEDSDEIRIADVLTLRAKIVERRPSVPLSDELRAASRINQDRASWLTKHFVGANRPGRYDFLELRRVSNLPERSYVMLFGAAEIGRSARALVRLPLRAEHRVTGRGLDFGTETIVETVGLLCWSPAGLVVTARAAAMVHVNSRPLNFEESAVLERSAFVQVDGATIRVVDSEQSTV